MPELQSSVESVKQEGFQGDYDASPKVNFSWEIPQPNNIALEIRERFVDYGSESFGLRFYKHQLEIKNIGTLSVKNLKLKHQWFRETLC